MPDKKSDLYKRIKSHGNHKYKTLRFTLNLLIQFFKVKKTRITYCGIL